MKRFPMFAVLLLSVFISGCGKKESAQELKVGINPQFPPFTYLVKGKYTGFDIELIAGIASRCNRKLTLVPIEWQQKFNHLNSGKVDCIISGFNILGREKLCIGTEPYADNTIVAVVRTGDKIQVLSDLAGRIVAVQKGTSVANSLKSGELQELGKKLRAIQEYPNFMLAAMMICSGAADALFVDLDLAQQLTAKHKGQLRILLENVSTEKYVIGFRKNNTALRDEVQTALRSMVANGKAAEISRKYFNGRNIVTIQQ